MDPIRPLLAVLDDEPQFCKALARLLKTHGFEVVTFSRGEEFLEACSLRSPDCLLLDLHMPSLNGFEVLERLATRPVPVIVITGHDQPENARRVRALGALDYFLKPVNDHQLLEAIRRAIAPEDSNPPPRP
jgi:FixJ family two-component response regulator